MNETQTEISGATARSSRVSAPDRPSLLPSDGTLTGVARVATIGIFLLLLTAALDLGRVLFLPLVSALAFAFIFGPLQVAAERRRVPGWLFALGCVLALIAIINLIIILTAAPLIEWLGRGPDIAKSLGDKLRILTGPFSAVRDLQHALILSAALEPNGLRTLGMTLEQCPHGVQFYDVVIDGVRHKRNAWVYESPQPKMAQVRDRFGFWEDVEVR